MTAHGDDRGYQATPATTVETYKNQECRGPKVSARQFTPDAEPSVRAGRRHAHIAQYSIYIVTTLLL